MNATLWLIISIFGFACAGVCLVLAVIIFFREKIPNVIGDLSGRRAAKEVAALRGDSEEAKKNAQSSGRTADFSAMAMAHDSKRLDQTTEKLKEVPQPQNSKAAEETEAQSAAITQVLSEPAITSVLSDPSGSGEHTDDLKRVEHFTIIRAITEIHTEEYV